MAFVSLACGVATRPCAHIFGMLCSHPMLSPMWGAFCPCTGVVPRHIGSPVPMLPGVLAAAVDGRTRQCCAWCTCARACMCGVMVMHFVLHASAPFMSARACVACVNCKLSWHCCCATLHVRALARQAVHAVVVLVPLWPLSVTNRIHVLYCMQYAYISFARACSAAGCIISNMVACLPACPCTPRVLPRVCMRVCWVLQLVKLQGSRAFRMHNVVQYVPGHGGTGTVRGQWAWQVAQPPRTSTACAVL